MEAVKIKLSDLCVNEGQIEGLPANPRFIRDEKFQKLKQSLIEDPEMLDIRELIVYPHPTMTGKYIIIGGNMRYNAAKELGMSELPCKILPEDTSVEKMRAYTIKDNVGYGEWDMDLLANEWETDELQDWGVDLPVSAFVSPDEYGEEFSLPNGDKEPFQQMTFTLADEQAEFIKSMLSEAKKDKSPIDNYGNGNTNGNAIYLIAKQWDEQRR